MNGFPDQPSPGLPGTSVPDKRGWDVRYTIYRTSVRNEITDETAVIAWAADCKESAQFGVRHMQLQCSG